MTLRHHQRTVSPAVRSPFAPTGEILLDGAAPRSHQPTGKLPLLSLALVVAMTGWVLSSGSTLGADTDAADQSGAIAPLTSSAVPAPPDGPFETLARPTDYTTVVLTRSGLELIDLDTAQRTRVPLPRPLDPTLDGAGVRMLVHGDTLVVPSGPEIWSVELGTGAVSALGLGDRVAPALTPDHLWVRQAEGAIWAEYDEHGHYVRGFHWPANALPWDHGSGTPELAWLPDGGIYRLEPDSQWSFVVDGVPVAVAGETALIQQCATVEDCRTQWFDVASGETIDRALPSAAFALNARPYRLSPSAETFLEIVPTPDSQFGVFTWKDRVVHRTMCGAGWRTAAWSADESLFACVSSTEAIVTDLRTGRTATFGDLVDGPLAVVLIPTETIGFAP